MSKLWHRVLQGNFKLLAIIELFHSVCGNNFVVNIPTLC